MIFRCRECEWTGKQEAIVQFQDPERAGNSWRICPECRAAEQFDNICDEPGCRRVAAFGWPSSEGYRRTCGDHMSSTP